MTGSPAMTLLAGVNGFNSLILLAEVTGLIKDRDYGLFGKAVCIIDTVSAIGAAFAGDWLIALTMGTVAVLLFIKWWRRKRKRRHLARVLGGKAKAKLAEMVRKMRELSPGRLVPDPA